MLGTFLITSNLLDFSLILYSQTNHDYTLLSWWFAFRASAPIILFPILYFIFFVIQPYLIYLNVHSVVGIFTRSAPRIRHGIDALNCITLFTVIYHIFWNVRPDQKLIAHLSAPNSAVLFPRKIVESTLSIEELVNGLFYKMVFLLFLNVTMLFIPFARWNTQPVHYQPVPIVADTIANKNKDL